MKTALLIVDLQNDFIPGGALAVNEGDKIIPIINNLLDKPFDLIIASKDWHPADHGSFAANHPGKKVGEHIDLHGLDQILWPAHCIQGSHGAEFAKGWNTTKIDKIIHKGTDRNIDSYSAFFDNEMRKATGLGAFLEEEGVTDLYIAGLATDYCVKYSVLDAVELGIRVHVVIDACRGVNLNPHDSEEALRIMAEAGAELVSMGDIEL